MSDSLVAILLLNFNYFNLEPTPGNAANTKCTNAA